MKARLKIIFEHMGRIYPLLFSIIFLAIIFQYPFNFLEAIFYDLRVKYDFGFTAKEHIVVVTLDEESDEFLGEKFPYTFASHERMLHRLMKDRPRSVGYLVPFTEPEGEEARKGLQDFKQAIRDLRNEGISFRFGSDMDHWGEVIPPQELQEIGYSLALLNIDNNTFARDNISRKAILNISGEDSFHLWMANEERHSLGKEILDAGKIKGASYSREADASFTLFRYGFSPVDTATQVKSIAFHRVVVGNFPKGFFEGKTVLVGSNYISNPSDYINTPFTRDTKTSPKLMVHAAIIDALVNEKTVYPIPRVVTSALCILLAVFLSYLIARMKPTHGLTATLAMTFVVLFASWWLFALGGLWLYSAHLILTIFIVYYIWVPFRAIKEYQTRFHIQEESKMMKKVEGLKQNFISLMSHDLKTPVAKIAGMADVMFHQYKADENLAKGLKAISDSTKELNHFITSILDLTKVESQNLKLNLSSKDANILVEEAIQELRFNASTKKMEMHKDLSPLYPISMDVILTKRVISNLIENAIKYAGEGKAVWVKSWDDKDWVYIEVRDNGVGIPENDLEHVFEKFYRVKNDATHSIKGTGLGLYLVKYFVELQGGQISVASKLGEGTTFLVKFKNA